MRRITIEARSRASASGLADALSGFGAELVEDGGRRWLVEIPVGESYQEVFAVLRAIERHVAARRDGAAHVVVDGTGFLIDGR